MPTTPRSLDEPLHIPCGTASTDPHYCKISLSISTRSNVRTLSTKSSHPAQRVHSHSSPNTLPKPAPATANQAGIGILWTSHPAALFFALPDPFWPLPEDPPPAPPAPDEPVSPLGTSPLLTAVVPVEVAVLVWLIIPIEEVGAEDMVMAEDIAWRAFGRLSEGSNGRGQCEALDIGRKADLNSQVGMCGGREEQSQQESPEGDCRTNEMHLACAEGRAGLCLMEEVSNSVRDRSV